MSSSGDGGGFDLRVVERRPGFCLLDVSGRDAWESFRREAGGHRIQRVPATEKRGRVQTSTVTVAVLRVDDSSRSRLVSLDRDSLDVRSCRGSGKGGQHRNKTDSAVVAVHLPTQTRVRVESNRSQHRNRADALKILESRLQRAATVTANTKEAGLRKDQIGSGQRGDKIRTVRIQDGRVTDHRTGKKTSCERYLSGRLEDLW